MRTHTYPTASSPRNPLLVALSLIAAPAWAQSPPATIEQCARIGSAADRLVCYDKLAGRAEAPVGPGDAQNPVSTADVAGADAAAAKAAGGTAAAATSTAPATTSLLAPKDAPVATARKRDPSILSTYWELDPEDKRGVFNLTGYRTNYVLPIRATNSINRHPTSPTQDPVDLPDYRRIEAAFQLSLRTKVAQDIGLPGGDVWLAFTQKSSWQVWNGTDSRPFRNSDYEPEMMYVVPTPESWRALPFGWQWRFTQLALAHQSNGQSDPLSRSWNRVYLGAGIERGDWTLTTRLNKRLVEDADTDNNPDLVTYRGRADFQLGWASGAHQASLLYRTTLKDGHYGAVQLEWTYPVFKAQPNGLRWMVQAFSGYGETLTDYNFRQTSLGLGLAFLQF